MKNNTKNELEQALANVITEEAASGRNSVKELLENIGDAAMAIVELEEGQTYPVMITDSFGEFEAKETALDRAKSMAEIILESYLDELYIILGIEKGLKNELRRISPFKK